MKKVQRDWREIADVLNERLDRCALDNIELSRASHANYHAVRRLRLTGVHNRSANARKLCSFFKIPLTENVKPQTDELAKLVSELETVWDGSAPHAKLLSKLIRSTKSFSVDDRPKD